MACLTMQMSKAIGRVRVYTGGTAEALNTESVRTLNLMYYFCTSIPQNSQNIRNLRQENED